MIENFDNTATTRKFESIFDLYFRGPIYIMCNNNYIEHLIRKYNVSMKCTLLVILVMTFFIGCYRKPRESVFRIAGNLAGRTLISEVPAKIIAAKLRGSLVIQMKSKSGLLISIHIPEPASVDYEDEFILSASLFKPNLTIHNNQQIVFRSLDGLVKIKKIDRVAPEFVVGEFTAVQGNEYVTGDFNALISSELSTKDGG